MYTIRTLILGVVTIILVAAGGYMLAPHSGDDLSFMPVEDTGRAVISLPLQGEPEPTKDYSLYPTTTPSGRPAPTLDPSKSPYFGMTTAEVAEAVRNDYAATSDVPTSIVTYAEIYPEDGEPLGIPSEKIARYVVPDVAVLMSGAFHSEVREVPYERTYVYHLVVVDVVWGPYSFSWEDDLDELLSMLP